MGRLYRPYIPFKVRCRVAERQLIAKAPTDVIESYFTLDQELAASSRLHWLLTHLAAGIFGCEVSDLRLDHDPPLAARPKERRGLGKKTHYIPDANDPEHLFYRPHGPQFEGSHLIKTNVRGDHGQHPDRVLIKKQRRIERGPKPRRGPKIRSRGFSTAKQKLPSRPFPKRIK